MCCRASSPIVHSPIVRSLVALHLRGLPCLGAVALCTGTAVLSTPVPCRHKRPNRCDQQRWAGLLVAGLGGWVLQGILASAKAGWWAWDDHIFLLLNCRNLTLTNHHSFFRLVQSVILRDGWSGFSKVTPTACSFLYLFRNDALGLPVPKEHSLLGMVVCVSDFQL